jgi:hypothetical protein
MTEAKGQARAGRFLGSLKDALVAASRDDTQPAVPMPPPAPALQLPGPAGDGEPNGGKAPDAVAASPSAEEAARQVRGASVPLDERHFELDAPPTTRVVRGGARAAQAAPEADDPTAPARTQLVRGKQRVERGGFNQDPVVGWLVIVGGPGIGSFRPIFEGNNTIGRSDGNRIPIDFGDDAISSEEQAFIRYDGTDRSFLFVPNLSKTNVVSVNSKRPTGAVELAQMDVITMGRTQLVFVPFCGPEFDWSALSEVMG